MGSIDFVKMSRNDASSIILSTDSDYKFSASSDASTHALVPCDVDDKIGFFVEWQTSNTGETGYITVKAGDEGLAFQRELGDATITLSATHQNKVNAFVGPFESARFVQSATSTGDGFGVGDSVVKLEWDTYTSDGSTGGRAGAGNIMNLKLVPFRMPTVF